MFVQFHVERKGSASAKCILNLKSWELIVSTEAQQGSDKEHLFERRDPRSLHCLAIRRKNI